jgi:hypothetical protein
MNKGDLVNAVGEEAGRLVSLRYGALAGQLATFAQTM